MNIIVAEPREYPLPSITKMLKQEYPRTSTLYCNNANLHELRAIIGRSPVLTTNWLIYFNLREITLDIVKEFAPIAAHKLFVVRSEEALTIAEGNFFKLGYGVGKDYEIVNNLRPPEDEVEAFIMESLPVTDKLAKFVAKRHKYYLPKIVQSVEILSLLPKITRASIVKYTDASSEISQNSFCDFAMGMRQDVSVNAAINLLYDYRYGIRYLIKYLCKRFDQQLFVYDLSMRGLLSLGNYREYRDSHKDEFKGITEYDIYRSLVAMENVSYDLLYSLSIYYKQELERGPHPARIVPLLQLVSTMGTVVRRANGKGNGEQNES